MVSYYYFCSYVIKNKSPVPAWVAQLDACPTGDQEVDGLTPRQIGNIL